MIQDRRRDGMIGRRKAPRQPYEGSTTPRVSVIIPNWNGARWLARCLHALAAQSYGDFEVIVVDNGSTDASRSVTERAGPGTRWIGFAQNRGFPAAVNAGIRAARGEFVALLNNDTEVDPRWLEALVDAMDRRPDVAILASRMLSDLDRGRIDSAGGDMNWYGVALEIGVGDADDGRFDDEREVFWAPAGAAFYRRSLFDDVGLFEESFFAYYEDVDLCFRAQLAGYGCLYVPAAVVYHVRSATAGVASDFSLRLGMRNRLLLIIRNYPWPLVVTKLRAVLLAESWLARYLWSRRRYRLILSAYGSLLFLLPRALAARMGIQRRRRISIAQLESLFERHKRWQPPSGPVVEVTR